jgi:D-ribose pyranose/furanose isomerase RbsD
VSERWEEVLRSRLPLYGHRNWIVVADSAYPAPASGGTETIVAAREHVAILAQVLRTLGQFTHTRPIIYTDSELRFVQEEDAPGVTAYREHVARLAHGLEMRALPHEEIIATLDRVAQKFRVLLIKTGMRIPYTSVFVELVCGYWNADAESRLRAAMATGNRKRVSPTRRTRRVRP